MFYRLAGVLVLSAIGAVLGSDSIPAVTHVGDEVVVFKPYEAGYVCFRYPSVVVLATGDLLMFAEGRRQTCDNHGWNDVVLKRSTNNGASWSAVQLVYSESNSTTVVTVATPSPVVDTTTGHIFVACVRSYERVLIVTSTNHGVTWSAATDISRSVIRPDWTGVYTGPPNGIQLASGTLMFFGFYTTGAYAASDVFFSTDHGSSWTLGGQVVGGTQGQGVQFANGSILLNMHALDSSDGHRLLSVSNDDGDTFSPAWYNSDLPDAGSEASMISWPPSSLLFSNPADAGSNQNMTIKVSIDNGAEWISLLSLWDGPCYSSSLVLLPNGLIGIAFEKGKVFTYERIVWNSFHLSSD